MNTAKGNALANATAAALLTRKTAEVRLVEFLTRVRQANSPRAPYALWIDKVVLLGSMISTKARVSDIDVSIKFVNKPDYAALSNQRISAALGGGRRFGSCVEQVCWPT